MQSTSLREDCFLIEEKAKTVVVQKLGKNVLTALYWQYLSKPIIGPVEEGFRPRREFHMAVGCPASKTESAY
jgi:hypothetical protein